MIEGKRDFRSLCHAAGQPASWKAWRWPVLFGAVALGVVVALLGAGGPVPILPLAGASAILFVLLVTGIVALSPHEFVRCGPGGANLVTFVRAALTLPLLVAIFLPELRVGSGLWWLVLTASCAVLLDGLDGWLARRFHRSTAFGARFDMEVDAWLILLLSVLVWQTGQAGVWVLLLGLMRYLFVAAGWGFAWLQGDLFPSRRRQTVCVVQSVALLVALLPPVDPESAAWVVGIALLALVYSFAVDTVWLYRNRAGPA